MIHRRQIVVLIALVFFALASPGAGRCESPRPAHHRADEASRLVANAAKHLALRTIEGRRAAVAELERATVLQPSDPDYQLMLGRAYYASGYVHAAMQRFALVVALVPADAGAHYGLG